MGEFCSTNVREEKFVNTIRKKTAWNAKVQIGEQY
jgi:hypothetical protein